MEKHAINMKDIYMSFGGVNVLKGVNFGLKQGEIRGLVGKNGAGKSTLVKIIHGTHIHKRGSIEFFGDIVDKNTSIKKREETISMIFQDFSLIPEMTVVENIFLNVEKKKGLLIDDDAGYRIVKEFFDRLDLDIDPKEKVKNLNTGDMQFVEITKAVLRNKKVLLMDEPTAALEAEQTEKLFSLIRKLKEDGITIVLITHHLQHIMELCDSVTVLRDGEVTLADQIKNITLQDMIDNMLGEKKFSQKKRQAKEIKRETPLLKVEQISSKKNPKGVSFELYPGEVLGLAGLKGSGRTEILNNLFGIDVIDSGAVYLEGQKLNITDPHKAYQYGISLVPENRQTQGLSLIHTIYLNIMLPILDKMSQFLMVKDKQGKSMVRNLMDRLQVKAEGLEQIVGSLSGGNQQKVVIAKSLATNPKVMLMDDPTYGVDIHAKSEIMSIIDEFTDKGYGVILVSSDLEELLFNCDRILGLKEHEIIEEIDDVLHKDLSEEHLEVAIQQ